jgi:transposase
VATQFFGLIVEQALVASLMSDEHFTVDGTLIEAWASLKKLPPQMRRNPALTRSTR